jgi:hypothetical protein
MPPGLYQYSIVVSTPQREMKFTAPTKERHDIWLNVSHPLHRDLLRGINCRLGVAIPPLATLDALQLKRLSQRRSPESALFTPA